MIRRTPLSDLILYRGNWDERNGKRPDQQGSGQQLLRCIPKQRITKGKPGLNWDRCAVSLLRAHTAASGLPFQATRIQERFVDRIQERFRRFVDPGISRTRIRSALVSRSLTEVPPITLDFTKVKLQVDIIECCKRALPYSLIVILIRTE